MDKEDRRIVIVQAGKQKYNLEDVRRKFWRIDTTFRTAQDYYNAERWIPVDSPAWVTVQEKTGGRDRQRFKNPEQGNEILTMPEPNASALMLNAARKDYERARLLNEKQRTAKAEEVDELEVSDIIFDMLEEDMKSIIMAYTAIEAFANETVQPEDEIYIPKKGKTIAMRLCYQEFTRMSLEEKLAQVLPEKLKISQIDKDDKIWQNYRELENLRHAIIHMEGEGRQSNITKDQRIVWERIYEAGVRWRIPAYMRAFELIRYYSQDGSGKYPNWIKNFPQTQDKSIASGLGK